MKRIYAILDTVADGLLGGLHIFAHDGPAVRFFGDIAGDSQTHVGRHPADFSLVCVGALTDENQLVAFDRTVIITGAQWVAANLKAPS